MSKLNYATPDEFAAEIAALNARVKDREDSVNIDTPWGRAQTCEILSNTVSRYCTSSHGGYHVADVSLALIKPEWRAYAKRWSGSENWFEEDCAWAFVAFTFPSLFKGEEDIEHAESTIKWLESNSKL